MPEPGKRDWLKIWIHSLVGAIVGALVGFVAWSKSGYAASTSLTPGLAFLGGGALLLGVLSGAAAEKDENFWHSLGHWTGWW